MCAPVGSSEYSRENDYYKSGFHFYRRQDVRDALASLDARTTGGWRDTPETAVAISVFGSFFCEPRVDSEQDATELLQSFLKEFSKLHPHHFVALNFSGGLNYGPAVIITAKVFASWIELLRNQVKSVRLSFLVLDDIGPLQETLGRQTQLEEFECDRVHFRADPVAFSHALGHIPNLKTIKFHFHLSGVRDSNFPAILSSFGKIPTLEELSLSFLPPGSYERFFDTIQACPKLKRLRLLTATGHHHRLSDSHVEYLGRLLQKNQSLEEFWALSVEKGVSLRPLALGLARNTTFRDLYLGSHVGQDDVDAFLELLEKNFSLENLLVHMNDLPKDDKTQQKIAHIQFLCKLNGRFQRKRLFSSKATREDWFDVIIPNKDNLSVVFYYLLNNPCLLTNV
jgi:hypothetical protein